MAKEEVLIDIKVDVGQSITNLDQLAKQTRELEKAKRQLDFTTAEGAADIKAYNQLINRNNEILKENSSALQRQRMNVGNYKKDIQDAIPALDQFSGGLASSSQGFLAMAKSAMAFIATPIGAILSAVAAVLGLVTAALKRSEPALDFFEDIIGSITEGARFLVDNLEAIASVLGNVLTGNISQAAATTGKLAEEFKNAQREAQRLREEFRELEDEEAKLIATTSGTEAQIKALIIQSKNRNITKEEEIALLKQADDLERKSTEQKVEFENRKSAAIIESIGNERDLRRAQNETIEAYTKRLIASEKLSGEEKKQVAEAYASRVQASTATLALQEKIQNAQDAALLKQEEEAKVRSQVAREREIADSEFRLQLLRDETEQKKLVLQELQDWINANNEAAEVAEIRRREAEFEKTVKEMQQNQDWFIEETNFETEEDIKRNAAALERLKKRSQDEIALRGFTEQAKLGILSNAFDQFSNILGRQTAEGKALATVQALIDTYAGANAQMKLPFPYNIIAATTTIATGLVNVAKIQGFANGGLVKSGFGLPIQRSNGDNVLATVKTGEVILNQRQQSALGGSRTFSAIGVPGFAEGGVVGFPSSMIDTPTSSLFDLTRLESFIANLKIYTAIQDVNDGQKNFAEITDKAQF